MEEKTPRGILIYGASCEDIDERFKEDALRAGRLIALSGHPLVCGGGRAGLMRCAIDGALEAGGEAIGVLPAFMAEKNWQHPGLTEMIVAADMHARKSRMAALSQAVIALPGGVGTFEELMEIITWRKLGLYDGPIVILNTLGYYAPLIDMLNSAVSHNFMREEHRNLFRVAATPEEAVGYALEATEK